MIMTIDLFEIRVSDDDDNGLRLAGFEVLVNRACDEIRQNHFN